VGGRALKLDHAEAMRRAFALAWRGWGRVGANPLVGAVVLKDGRAVAEGWHAAFGGPHAEAQALQAAGREARGATLVVTLEPCRHHGKTPPCVDAIVAAGVERVVYGAPDVDPEASGGAEALLAAGVAVEGDVFGDDVRAQNAGFFHRHEGSGRPFVAVKLAMSLDGRIADARGRSRWISGEEAQAWVHWLRAGFDAIGVGLGTVRADDPRLTVRGSVTPLAAPLRVVFDGRAELPTQSVLRRTAAETPTLVLVGPKAPAASVRALRAAGVHVDTAAELAGAMRVLRRRGVTSLLVEGGGSLAGRLVAAGLVDRLYLITSPLVLGADGVPAFGALAGAELEHTDRWRVVGRSTLGADALTVLDRP